MRSEEGRKSKGRLFTRLSFRYLNGEISLIVLNIDFVAENQDDIGRTVKIFQTLLE